MKKRIIYFASVLVLTVTAQIQAAQFKADKRVEEIFKKEKINGTFILYDVNQDTFIGYNEERGEKLYPPASTFKIVNSLIGLAAGSVKNVDEVFYQYDGSKMYLKTWEKDMNLREAIKVSQVPAYQKLARLTGLEKMQENIIKLDYGNKNIGDKVDTFWLEGPLKISAIQQTEVLAKLAQGQLPYPEDIQRSVREISKLEEGEKWTLYGKTGWAAGSLNPRIGWFVGWIEENEKVYSFAINMDTKDSSLLPKREEIAKKSLKALGLLKD